MLLIFKGKKKVNKDMETLIIILFGFLTRGNLIGNEFKYVIIASIIRKSKPG